jgi:hypothetical protein
MNRDDSGCRDTIGYERTIDESLLMEDRACLDATGAGDSAAFVRLYEKHINSVYRYALQMLRSVPEAEDIAQEVFILAWVKRTKIRIVDQSVLPWLLVTTRNLRRVRRLPGPQWKPASSTSRPNPVRDFVASNGEDELCDQNGRFPVIRGHTTC